MSNFLKNNKGFLKDSKISSIDSIPFAKLLTMSIVLKLPNLPNIFIIGHLELFKAIIKFKTCVKFVVL